MKKFISKLLPAYQRSLWIRNILLILFLLALIAMGVKIRYSLKKINLYEEAKKHYQERNLLAAEESFAKAQAITTISYGDEAWNKPLSTLRSIRQQLESISWQIHAAAGNNQVGDMLELYTTYHTFKQHARQEEQLFVDFFTQVSEEHAIEATLKNYFLAIKKTYTTSMQENLTQQNYRDERFVHSLVAIPDEFFGGEKQKKQELISLFRSYDQKKYRDVTNRSTFDQVIQSASRSLRAYKQVDIQGDWLLALLEKYASSQIKRSIRNKDLDTFIMQAKAYRQISDVLPTDSESISLLDQHLASQLKQAERYTKANQFEKARDLYQKLSDLQDTSQLVTELEDRWIKHDPIRLLKEKYPDKSFGFVLTGEKRWGSVVYTAGISEEDQHLHLAAKMPDDHSVLYLEESFHTDTKLKNLSISDTLISKETPILIVEATGKNRLSTYYGFVPDLSKKDWVKLFEAEADGFTVEGTGSVILENAEGKGEKEIAAFKLEDNGLVYEEKIRDYLSPSPETEPDVDSDTVTDEKAESGAEETSPHDNDPASPSKKDGMGNSSSEDSIKVYAGPGEEYGVIGQIKKGSPIEGIADQNGWYQISFNGNSGWVRPDPLP
ncbi:SH3 domain-containing protein [Brevibacillus laterosporus]|uniref:SH3 domain-containing protein n=1 Tax=Brevibacillus halotolerans TaxID=1507437 RepID=A0ABT4HT38_9BACL|nr:MULTISPECIES: SH3 domain-containing protein [Brevibacillus]MCR8984239.1 SH3 domain-containing protein [Brevibacillus laterosporus]MCZ0829960.1 SH3 domain-containing protein [Brevibacillus halotolerans]